MAEDQSFLLSLLNFINFFTNFVFLFIKLERNGHEQPSASIAWTRIFPRGKEIKPNEKGLQFYEKVIHEVMAAGMELLVTMFHYDILLPLLTDYGRF